VSDTLTVTQGIARLRAFGEDHFVKAVRAAIQRAMGRGRTRAAQILKKSTVGQAVSRRGRVRARLARGGYFGRKATRTELSAIRKNVIPLIVTRSKVRERLDFAKGTRSWSSGLETRGFAALIETGGRTKSHPIKPLRAEGYSRKRAVAAAQLAAAGRLTFPIGGRWVSPKIVTHPGSRVPRNPFIASGAAHAQEQLEPQLEQGISDAVKKAGL
jgi:hypothetical protein